MKKRLRNCLFLNNVADIKRSGLFVLVFFFLFGNGLKSQKIGNYVNNGSFENYFVSFVSIIPYYWSALDSSKYYGQLLITPSTVPLSSYAYQSPLNGRNHFITTAYSNFANNNRGYPRNRLKENLDQGKTYCVSMYINLSNQSTHGIDAIGIHLANGSVDSIKKCNVAITYLVPQIENSVNNWVTDTLNWISVKGTFIANGTEKYLIIGNFKNDTNTNKVLVDSTNLPTNFSDYLIDAVSVIEVNLPAYAGPDQSIISGDSVYIGREPDFAIDSGCVWFKLPEMTALDTISGMWVKPSVTTTYVVRQILDCSSEKWDTVVVYKNLVGLEKLKMLNEELKIYPVPANNFIELSISNTELLRDFKIIKIFNSLGEVVREEELGINFKIGTEELGSGVYFLQLNSLMNETVNKRFVISK